MVKELQGPHGGVDTVGIDNKACDSIPSPAIAGQQGQAAGNHATDITHLGVHCQTVMYVFGVDL